MSMVPRRHAHVIDTFTFGWRTWQPSAAETRCLSATGLDTKDLRFIFEEDEVCVWGEDAGPRIVVMGRSSRLYRLRELIQRRTPRVHVTVALCEAYAVSFPGGDPCEYGHTKESAIDSEYDITAWPRNDVRCIAILAIGRPIVEALLEDTCPTAQYLPPCPPVKHTTVASACQPFEEPPKMTTTDPDLKAPTFPGLLVGEVQDAGWRALARKSVQRAKIPFSAYMKKMGGPVAGFVAQALDTPIPEGVFAIALGSALQLTAWSSKTTERQRLAAEIRTWGLQRAMDEFADQVLDPLLAPMDALIEEFIGGKDMPKTTSSPDSP